MAGAHVFVADLDAPALDERDHHHLTRVLRIRPGEDVTASDGAGGVRPCVVDRDGGLCPVGAVEREPRPAPEITVGFAVPKGVRPEWLVQKLTECGVDRIAPFVAARTVVRWDTATGVRNVARLRRIAREAAMQARRRWLPEVLDVQPFSASTASALGAGIAIASPDGRPPTLATPAVFVGPEGGWTDDELATVEARVRLGPHVLRVETAAMVAGALLVSLRDGLVRPAGY